ncbi:MAG: efflux RND transporter periplasmic adaptor subunit [Proteobacteria bacterium]|nr:efflux RND transporter periplasmic adaptor subunit [Pseudomonadota bacterium]
MSPHPLESTEAAQPAGRGERPWRRLLAWRPSKALLITLILLVALVVVLRLTVLAPPVVSVAEVARGDLTAEVEGTGTVTADAVADIASKITGRVEQVFANEGDLVREGQTMARLDDTGLRRELDEARARLASAQVTTEEAEREWSREKGLVKTGAASVEDFQQYEERLLVARSARRAAQARVRAAEYDLSLVRVPSLVSGLVTKRWVVPGASVVPGQPLFTVADTGLAYVGAHMDQNFTGRLKNGEAATVILRGREDTPRPGHVLRISPQADPDTEETIAEVAFQIAPGEFQLGEWANVYVQVGAAHQALLVPRAALMPMGVKKFVFILGPGERIRREPVTILAESPRRPVVAVSGALQPHERVVLMPMGLSSGQFVRARSATAMSEGSAP